MPSPFLPIPSSLTSIADAAERLNVSKGTLRVFLRQAKRRPAWLHRWLATNGKRLSPPVLIPRILKDGKHGRMAYVKASDVALIERAKAARRRQDLPTQIVHRGEVCLSVPEFARRSGMNEMTVYYRIRQGLLPAIKKRSPKRHGIRGNVPTIYVPVSQLADLD